MVIYDWGIGEEPSGGASTVARIPKSPGELPDVIELEAQGWRLAPDAPMWVFLPAVWPRSHRAWVPDRATRWVTNFRDGQLVERVPWSDALYADLEADANDLLRQVEIAPRPPGRLWLLKPPASFSSVDKTLDALIEPTLRSGSEIEPNCNRAFVEYAQRVLSDWFGRPA